MNAPKLVAIETTRRCNLHCIHCRAAAGEAPEGELTRDEIFRLFDALAERGRPIVILTGGEPLMREDIFEIARRGADLGFHMSMAPNGTLMDDATARRMIASGIQRIAISLDAATAEVHDAFRRMPGAFAGAMKGIEAARKAGLPFQINTSVTAFNAAEVPKVHELAKSLGAAGHHIFMLVRVGRGRALDAELPPAEQEKLLHWLHDRSREGLIAVRATCAPHYFRILTQGEQADARALSRPLSPAGGEGQGEGVAGSAPVLPRRTGAKIGTVPEKPGQSLFSPHSAITRGCTAGDRFVFISSTGHVQPCGYLEIDCGDLRRQSFWDIWDNSPVLQDLRHEDRLKGKCGICEFRSVCGGCRARAYAATGDYLAEEPACVYKPK